MADLATPSAAAISTIDAKADPPTAGKTAVTRPERPDEATFKESLAKAEKELAAIQEKQVGIHHLGLDRFHLRKRIH